MKVEEHEDDCGLSMDELIEKQPSRSLTYNKGYISFSFEDKDVFTVSPKHLSGKPNQIFAEQEVLQFEQSSERIDQNSYRK